MRNLLSAFVLLLAVHVQAATYYIDYATGSDSNTGTSTAAPWKRAPGMKGFAGSYSHTAGDRFVFKGGVTWPVSCFQMHITSGGSSDSVRDRYESDPTWFAGAAFTRPLFDFQHTPVGPGWLVAAGVLVDGVNYIMFDNLELANHRVPRATEAISLWGSTTICLNNVNSYTLTNCVVRDWDQPTSGGTENVEWNGGGAIMRVNNGTANRVTGCLFHQDNVTQKSGTCVWNMQGVDHNEMRNTPQAIMYCTGNLNDNYIHHLPDPADPRAHSNAFLCPGTLAIFNNIIHDTSAIAQNIFVHPGYYGAGEVRVYNNVVYNVGAPCIATDTDGVNNPAAINRFYNNTLVGPGGVGYCIRAIWHENAPAAVPYIEERNNHLISSSPYGFNNTAVRNAPVTTLISSFPVIQTLPTANALGYTDGNNYAPLDATKPTVVSATDLSAYFTTDVLGNPRPNTSGLWNIGAYSFVPTTGVPGTITLSASSASVTEGNPITVTASRTGGTSGAVGVSYATANGSAVAGVNYTAASGTLSWANGDSADKTFSVTTIDADVYGNPTFTATISTPTGGASLGTPTTQTITINGTGSAPITLLSGTNWTTASDVAAPMTRTGSYYSQPSQTGLANGGILNYYFTNSPGTYAFYAVVDAPSDSANSIYWSLNSTAVDPNNIVDFPVTSGPEERAISQRGPTGTFSYAETNLVQVFLEGGRTNHLQVIGREPNTLIYAMLMKRLADPVPTQPPTIVAALFTTMDGFYKDTSNIVATLQFSTNVTVTGTPVLTNNAGGVFSYTSGSGSDTLTFTYTVSPGDNSQDLDYAATNSLSTAGGSIKFGTTDADLTLPTPNTPGSLSYNRQIVIDTTPPAITIGAPSLSVTSTGGTVFFTITYSDTNFASNVLTDTDVTLNGISGTVQVGPNSFPLTSIGVTLSALSDGIGNITVLPNGAYDYAGNFAPGAGPSASFLVTGGGRVIQCKAGLIISNVHP